MKTLAEISYTLDIEPSEFTQAETTTRIVYIWSNRRGYLIPDVPWKTYSRLSIMDSQPDIGFMEIWSEDKNDISDPPHDADDMWTENYKLIEKKNYSMEWHPQTKQLKIVWLQLSESLKAHKIITQVMTEIENLNLACPNFPKINSKE